jgi:hypothetical protein
MRGTYEQDEGQSANSYDIHMYVQSANPYEAILSQQLM